MTNYVPPEKLNKNHKIKQFDSGNAQLNDYLKKYAFQNQRKNISNTFVAQKENKVIGYYTLTFGSVLKEDLPLKAKKNLPNYPMPVLILARLAVDKNEKGKSLGKGLLKDAVLRTLQASEIAGIKAIMVKAKDQEVKRFYEKFDFITSPIDDLILFLPIEFLKN
ncbi:MAG: GNAT family N-acetyltransferase [Candidatus Gastranaerophilaceae bacterium]|jgi:predicted N-acetyltransferase YhbS